jgi:hypothetical protein
VNEEEFVMEARKRGLRDENIPSAIEAYTELKKYFPDFEFFEIIKIAIKNQKEADDNPDGFISVD